MKHTECKECKYRQGDCGHHFEMDGAINFDIASLSACDQYENCMFFERDEEERMTNKEAREIMKGYREQLTNSCSNNLFVDIEAFDIAIEALEEKVDPRNDPHYDECDYCKHSECSSDEYPCCECSHAVDFLSKWEKVE